MNHNTKQSFFNAAKQAGAAKQWAQMKANRRFKPEKSDKQPYIPGKSVLGVSAVSEAIIKDYGVLCNRRYRKMIAKAVSPITKLKRFFNGESPIRVEHIVKPSKYSGARG